MKHFSFKPEPYLRWLKLGVLIVGLVIWLTHLLCPTLSAGISGTTKSSSEPARLNPFTILQSL